MTTIITDNCDMNLFDPENMELKPGNIDLYIPEGSKMTVSASVDSLYCIGLRASGRDIDLKMSKEQAVKLARGILAVSGEERPQGKWKFLDHKYYDDRSRLLWAKFKCACCGEIRSFYEIPETIGEFDTDNFCPNCGARMGGG